MQHIPLIVCLVRFATAPRTNYTTHPKTNDSKLWLDQHINMGILTDISFP